MIGYSRTLVTADPFVSTQSQSPHPSPLAAPSPGAVRLAGYAAIFNLPDAARDTITPGAFKRSLAERQAPLPLFFQHNPEQAIGVVEHVSEDARGLRVIARIDNPDGRAAAMLRSHQVTGLSFGYRARGYRMTESGRRLEDIELYEVSLVTHPLQDSARVHLVS